MPMTDPYALTTPSCALMMVFVATHIKMARLALVSVTAALAPAPSILPLVTGNTLAALAPLLITIQNCPTASAGSFTALPVVAHVPMLLIVAVMAVAPTCVCVAEAEIAVAALTARVVTVAAAGVVPPITELSIVTPATVPLVRPATPVIGAAVHVGDASVLLFW